MKKFSLFAILLGFNIALGACSDDDAAPVCLLYTSDAADD